MRAVPVTGTYYVLHRYRNFPGKEKLMSVVWVHTLMTSVYFFTISPSSPWGVE